MKYSDCPSTPNIKRLGDDKIKEVIDHVRKEFSESDDRLKNWKEKVVKYYDLYNMVQRKKNYDGLAQIFVPEILRAVETVVTKLYGMIVGQPDWFAYSGRDGMSDDDGPALALTQLTYYQMEENNFKARLMDSLRQMVITGLTVRKVLWDYQKIDRKRRSKGNMGPEIVSDTIKDTWTFEGVDLLTFQISDVDIPYNDLQKATWIGEQYLVKNHYVRQKMAKGWFSDAYRESLEAEDGELEEKLTESSPSHNFQERKLSSSGFTVLTKPTGRVELIERWGLCPAGWVLSQEELDKEGLDEDDQIESVIVIANRKYLLKLEKNPFWHNQKPYASCPYIPKENEFAGIGAAQVGETLQEEINDTRNQSMDNKTLILMTMWLKSKSSGIKNQELRIRPNGVVTTNDINGLVPLRPPIVSGVGTNMEGIAKNDLREAAGASSNLQGIAQAGVDTATESSEINRDSLGRLVTVAIMYGELVLKPTFRMSEYLNYQFYDHEKVINIIGPIGVKYVNITPEQIAGDKNISIKIDTDSTSNPSVARQQLMNLLTILIPLPPQQLQFHWNLLSKIYGSFFAGHNLDELYPSISAPQEILLSPEEERDCVLAGKPVLAKQGQDHQAALDYLTKEFDSMKWALDSLVFTLFEKLIGSHHQMLMADLEAQRQQFMMQQAMAAGGKDSNSINGTTPNATPFTQTSAPSGASIARTVGG